MRKLSRMSTEGKDLFKVVLLGDVGVGKTGKCAVKLPVCIIVYNQFNFIHASKTTNMQNFHLLHAFFISGFFNCTSQHWKSISLLL